MYYPYFIAYILIGLTLSLSVFFWALKTGQFKDQQRARFLPLRDNAASPPVRASRASRLEVYSLCTLTVAGLGASAAVLFYAISSRF